MAEDRQDTPPAEPTRPARRRRLTNSELRLRRRTAEEIAEPRGICEIFADADLPDEDAPLARDEDDSADR